MSEKKMSGGLAFLTAGNMTVGVHGADLIARFDMTGRPMRGWILVASADLSDHELERWIDRARR